MISSRLAVCADTILQDAATNSVSAINLVEVIESNRFPITLPRLTALFLLVKDPSDEERQAGQVTIQHGGSSVYTEPVTIDFKAAEWTRLIVVVGGLVIPGPGELVMSLAIGDRDVAGWTIPIGAR